MMKRANFELAAGKEGVRPLELWGGGGAGGKEAIGFGPGGVKGLQSWGTRRDELERQEEVVQGAMLDVEILEGVQCLGMQGLGGDPPE